MTSSEEPSNPAGGLHASHRVRSVLQAFLRERGARLTLLVERSGSVISAAGNPGDADPLALASIASAHFNANEQLASTLGERDFTSLLHQGERTSVYLVDVAGATILVALFDEVRTADRVIREGESVVVELEGPVRVLLERNAPDGHEGLSVEWVRAAEAEIERVFRDEA